MHGVKGKREMINQQTTPARQKRVAIGRNVEQGRHTVCGLRWQKSQWDLVTAYSLHRREQMMGEGRGRVEETHTPDGVI